MMEQTNHHHHHHQGCCWGQAGELQAQAVELDWKLGGQEVRALWEEAQVLQVPCSMQEVLALQAPEGQAPEEQQQMNQAQLEVQVEPHYSLCPVQ